VPRQIRYDAWSPADGTFRRADAEVTTWTSAWCEPGFAFTDLVASWAATTPRGSWVEVGVQARGTRTWHGLGTWASGRRNPRRTSVTGDPEVDTDVWRPRRQPDAYRLRVRLHGTAELHRVGAVVSAGPARADTSPPLRRTARVVDVPRLSQLTFAGVGGRGWCSPTALSMVLSHAGRLPPGTDLPRAAAEVDDPAYGTGNWSFNTAWAAALAENAFVTRLHDLREAEEYVDAGIPLVASVAYAEGALRGAPTRGTDGHLLVIRGFTAEGDVVVNDPAAPTERSVRRTYDRAQLERAWLDGSGGLVYVIQDSRPGQR
jgi:hypothetical protein